MRFTSSPRRALGLLAAGTIGLSTALLGVTGVASAEPDGIGPVAAAASVGPAAPFDIDVYGGDGQLEVWFNRDDAAGGSEWADRWEYQLSSTGGAGNTSGWTAFTPQNQAGLKYFEFTGLTNGTDYSITLRGVGLDTSTSPATPVPGTASAPEPGTPYKPVGAPGSPTVTVGPSSLKVSWTAPATTGTYGLGGYEVLADLDLAPGAQMGGPTTICKTAAATTSCTAAVKPGRAYQVEVHALDMEGYGDEGAVPVTSAVVPGPTVPAAVPAKNGDLKLAAGSTSTVTPGKKITVSGTGYLPGSSVSVVIYSTPQVLTTVVADASGNFTVEVTIPTGLAAGNHTLVASGVDANGVLRYVTLPVTVATAGGGAKLANTGADVTIPALGGIATLGLGAGLMVVARRRRTAA